jgi:xanthine phosphoribosyltransferase
MKLLEEKILCEGRVLPGGVLKVDSFLNQQIDVKLLREMAKEWYRLFENDGITKILTIEASGIGIACITAEQFDVPAVYAKKTRGLNMSDDCYVSSVVSYTHGNAYNVIVSKPYISENDKVLIVDDFLANGSALKALVNICRAAGAEVIGAGIAIEKVYQGGGKMIRDMGVRVESLAKIESVGNDGKIIFEN